MLYLLLQSGVFIVWFVRDLEVFVQRFAVLEINQSKDMYTKR